MKLIKPLAIAFLLPVVGAVANEKAINEPISSLVPQARAILAQDTLSWTAPLPFDDEVTTGKLSNGFTYYIRKNTEPENRVTMYLAVKAGSILETDEEQGLAHFLEHMNFNGLKHFPKNELVNYLQKAGVRFGSDLNAYTSFDETVYQLPIPSDDPELLKNGLQVMRDWAQDAMLDTEEIDKERGVILEEMRGGRGAQQRMRDQYFPMMLNGSKYAQRLPIGTEDIVTNFDPEVIRNFHKKWYRPDLQSLIIVGDIDVAQMEAEVKRLFGDMREPKNPEKREEYKVSLLNKNQFMVVTDPEMQHTVGQIFYKHPEEKIKTVGDYRRSLMKSVFNQMVNARLGEIEQTPDAPFLQSGISISPFIAGLDNLSAYFAAKPGKFEESFKAVMTEMNRVRQFGFTQTEFDRAIANIQKFNENVYIERDKKPSVSYVKGYLAHFLQDAPALSNEEDYKITKELLPTLTLSEVEAIGNEYYVDLNRDVLIKAPEKGKESLPTEATVASWFEEVAAQKLTAYEDKVSDLPLLSTTPQKGTVVSEKNIEAIAAKEIVLSNGIKVVLKPTTFKNDEILIGAFSPGGTSLYSDADYFSASYAASLVNGSGLGNFNTTELRKYLTGKNVNISPSISERYETISGSTDKEGLKTAFEMIYGYFTAPRIEEDIYQSSINQALSSLDNRENNPSFVFSASVLDALYGGNIRRVPQSEEGIKQIDKDRALEIYKERFADASDFTFTIVGSFTEEEIKPYLEEYIASLPTLERKENYKDLAILEPKKGLEKVVHKGKEQKAQVQLMYIGDYNYSPEENMTLSALESVLSFKLLERLREEESGVYGTSASASYAKLPRQRYSFYVGFGTSVDKYPSLIASTLDEIRKVKENGPLQGDLDKFVIEKKRQFEVDAKQNRYWLGRIYGSLINEEDPTDVNNYLSDLEAVTVESVKAIANKYLNEELLFKFILLPDEVPASE